MDKDEILDLLLQDKEQLQFFYKIKMKDIWITSDYGFRTLLITNKRMIIISKFWFNFPKFAILPKNKIINVALKKDWIAIKWKWNNNRGKFKFRISEKDKIKRRTLSKNIYENLSEISLSQTS